MVWSPNILGHHGKIQNKKCKIMKKIICTFFFFSNKLPLTHIFIGLDKRAYLVNIFPYFSMKTYVMDTH